MMVKKIAKLDLRHVINISQRNQRIHCTPGITAHVITRHRRLPVGTGRIRRRQCFIVGRSSRMIFCVVAVDAGNFERSKLIAGRTDERRRTHFMHVGNMIRKVSVGNGLVRTESASTWGGRIIGRKDCDPQRGWLNVGSSEVSGIRSEGTRGEVAQVTAKQRWLWYRFYRLRLTDSRVL